MAPNHSLPHPCSEAPTPSPNTQVHPVGKSKSGEYLMASRELWGISTGAESHTPGLVKLADIITTLCKREKERLPARMNFDQSEGRKFSLRDCHGQFQQRENFDTKQT